MQIHGFNKTTLLDYPGIVASTIFVGACNFRCPYCQNADLVLNPGSQPQIPQEEVLNHLVKRKNIVKGICISGGEPTLQKDLIEFIEACKEVGVLVKLDSNGYRPEILEELAKRKLIDYIAMDIKSSLDTYEKVAGVKVDTGKITESIELIKSLDIDYEFRTTVMRECHNEKVFEDIANMLKGAGKYFLQGYVDSDRVICPGFSAYSYDEMKAFLPIFEGKIEKTEIRGVE